MKPNFNVETGTHYGIIRANSLDWELVDDLLYHYGTDLSYQEAYAEIAVKVWQDVLDGEVKFDDAEEEIERRTEDLHIEESIIEGVHEGIRYRTSWLGGALHFFIFDSPYVGLYEECSPCVPNAGNLECPYENGEPTYDVPADWRREE